MQSILCLALAGLATADLRMASQPKSGWKVQQRNRDVQFQQDFAVYMEPSAFGYAGLAQQRDGGGYDNFLRSNIDNEQDRRDFYTEDGKDHLPFRSFETAANDASETVKNKLVAASAEETNVNKAGNYIKATPGEPYTVPLRWNNPHSAEIEVNIWIMNKAEPYVIPVMKPSCSGEGYQDNAFVFTVPPNFNEVAACSKVGDCVLQIYAHSVESRMYASGTPLVVTGGTGKWSPGTIQEAREDVKFDLQQLRRLCLPNADPNNEINHETAVVYKARLSSDQYNHAYQNSDFSPYAGQQPHLISQNMQAACLLKMTVGNFGELGKQYMGKTAAEATQFAKKLDKKARNLIRVYETTTNSIIEATKEMVKNNNTMPSVAPPAGSSECIEWRDLFDKVVDGRVRGKDRTGGFCVQGLTCLCKHDCHLGHNDKAMDAYCAVLEADGSEAPVKNSNGSKTTDGNGNDVLGPSGKKKIKADTDTARIGRSAQKTETCFRCGETGSTVTKRQNTNTYIPSFEIQGRDVVNEALLYVAPIYLKSGFLTHPDTGLISQKDDDQAIVQIYMAVLTEMWDEFKMASDGSYLKKYYTNRYNKLPEPKTEALKKYMFTYRGPVLKTTKSTLADATNFKKLDADDKGFYAAEKAWGLQSRDGGSSTAVPNTAGPLDGTILRSFNMAATAAVPVAIASGGTGNVYKLPPPEILARTSCPKAKSGDRLFDEITEEGDDMDGLNSDADCDNDEFIEKVYAAHDADCLAISETNTSYACPPYPEVPCVIAGQGAILPGQMFTNADPGYVALLAEEEEPSAALSGGSVFLIIVVIVVVVVVVIVVTHKLHKQKHLLKELFPCFSSSSSSSSSSVSSSSFSSPPPHAPTKTQL